MCPYALKSEAILGSEGECEGLSISSDGGHGLSLCPCTEVHHMILGMIPKGIHRSPRIRSTHPSIPHPSIWASNHSFIHPSTPLSIWV